MSNYSNDEVTFDLIGSSVKFYGDSSDQYFSKLAAHAAQNLMLYELMEKNLQSKSIFLDVGANIGVTSRAARIVNPFCKIYCLEPSPKAYYYLKKNSDSDWIIFNCGAGAEERVVDFCEAEFLAGSSIELGSESSRLGKKIINIKVNKIDSIIADNNIQDFPTFVKIDVEGFEKEVIEGSLLTIISNNYPVLIFESWGDWKLREVSDASNLRNELMTFVKSLGYTIEEIGFDMYIAKKIL